jgi:predicted metal-dependent hydrolase
MIRDTHRQTLTPGEELSEPIQAVTFKTEVRFWAQRLGVDPRAIHLVALSRKWASCSARGRVTFDTALLSQPEEFRRHVIIHELLHLKVPNHGRLFSALLRTYMAAAGSAY